VGNWKKTKIGEFLQERKAKFEPDSEEIQRLRKIDKISFSDGKIHLGKYKLTKTKQIIVEPGDFVFSGLNIEKGAVSINQIDESLVVSTNYSTCCVDYSIINQEYFLRFIKSPIFKQLLIDNLKKDYGFTRPKHLLPLEIDLPSIEEQKEIVTHFKSIETEDDELKDELTHQQTLLKKLRQQILQEAIEGKLTADWRAQNPDLEPASELLARIQTEKQQLIKDKKIKKQKPLPAISEDEKPFVLPNGWVWCRLGEIMENLTDYHANGAYKKLKDNVELLDRPDFAIMLRTTNFHHKSRNKYKYITQKAYDFLSKSKVLPGDLIMNKIADPGAVFFVDDRKQPMSLAMNLFLLKFSRKYASSRYAYFYLKATYEYVVSFSSGTATPTITKDAVKQLRFPFPPLPEQKAIVAKVEKLLSVCDLLETQITHNQNHANALMQAVLKEAFSQTTEQTKPVAANG